MSSVSTISYEERLLPQCFSVIDIIIERSAPTPGGCVVLKMSLRSVVNFHGAQTHHLEKATNFWQVFLVQLIDSIKLDKVHHHFANFSIRTFKPPHEIYTAAVRMCAKLQIASINDSEDKEILKFYTVPF